MSEQAFLPADAERRLIGFTELVATAVSNATTYSQLLASRARIVTAGDEARRRIERNLHDGTQQRLVSLGLDLQTVRASLPPEHGRAREEIARVAHEIESILDDVRDLSRGLHPPLLAQGGLSAALRSLSRKSPISVDLEVNIDTRPSEAIEIAAYYVVAEALTNAAKYSRASLILVRASTSGTLLTVSVSDDGIGGAEASAGTGLVGLIDRVEAFGGRFALNSPRGQGTTVSIELPLATPAQLDSAEPASRSLNQASPRSDLAHVADAEALVAAIVSVVDGLYIVNARGQIRYLNETAVRLLGYREETQLLGRPSHDTIHHLRPDGRPFPVADCPLLRPRVTGETVHVERDWFVRQDGSLVPVAYTSAPLSLPDGRGAVVSFNARLDEQEIANPN